MKKHILILLLFTGFLNAQTLQNPTFGNTTTNTLKIKTPATVIAVNFIPAYDTDGFTLSKIAPINVNIPYSPSNYSAPTQTIGNHLAGIDTRLGQISSTSAGLTQRVWFTADNTTVTSGTFFASNPLSKGETATGSPIALVLGDNVKAYFNKDLISGAQPSTTIGYAGTYSGNLTVSATPTPNATQQRFTLEVYRCNNGGTPIASGVTGAPVGDLGVTVIAILDSGLVNLLAGAISNVAIAGQLTQNITINSGERLRYHVSAQKVGTGGGNVTFSVYYGSSYNSYYDVPVAITTDAVLNKSSVTGITSTDALNNNKALADGKLDELYVNNGYIAQNSTSPLTSSVYESFPLMFRGQSNKMFVFYRQGTDHATSKGVIQMRSSNDGGGTWTTASTIISDPTYDCRNVSGGIAPNGRFILFYMRYAFGSALSFDQGYVYSDNEGQTWSSYITIPNGTHTFFSPYGNLINIGDGKIMANWYGETPGTPTYSSYVITSSDNGLTWGAATAVITSTSIRYGEASYAYLDGGIIVGQIRNSVGSPLYQFKSIDNGATWSAQGQTTVDTGAQVSPDLITYVDPNNNKYIASFYANRSDNKLKVAIADYATASAGVSGWTRSDIDTHSSTDFGYPSAVKSRENNKFLLAYYKAASTSLSSIYFSNYTTNYGNISVVGSVSSTGNISSNTNVSAVATVSGKDLTSTNFLTIKGTVSAFPTVGNGWEAYNSTSSQSILQSYNRTGANYNEVNIRGSFLTWNIGATEKMRLHASGAFSFFNTTDPGAGIVSVTGKVQATVAPTVGNDLTNKTYVDGLVRPYKVYTAIFNQSGTSAPSAPNIFENTIGAIVWTRTGVGTYVGTLSGAFTASKTIGFLTNTIVTGATPINVKISSSTTNTIDVVSYINGAVSDNAIGNMSLEIRVYL